LRKIITCLKYASKIYLLDITALEYLVVRSWHFDLKYLSSEIRAQILFDDIRVELGQDLLCPLPVGATFDKFEQDN
jgi:hypothetical protein